MEAQVEFHTREQQEAMLQAVKEPRHRVMILLMLDGGMRVTEARKRHWEECDFRAKVIKINSLKKREISKKKERVAPMSDRLYSALDL
ncbi:tyrosine-type recombinase/integrase [Spirosoma koreense]